MQEVVGARVTELREKAGLKQGELSRRIAALGGKLSQQQISAIEKGVGGRTRSLFELAQALTTSQDYLLGRTDDPVHKIEIAPSKNTRTVDATEGATVPLWSVVVRADRGVTVQQIAESKLKVPRVPQVADIKSAFAVCVWNDDNAPWLIEGVTVFVDPTNSGRALEWCLFARRAEKNNTVLVAPLIGVKLGRTGGAYRVQVGAKEILLSISEYPVVWRIANIAP